MPHPSHPYRPSQRLFAIDLLRGLVIVLMALDHTRDFFAPTPFNPLDLHLGSPAWFWTRWITHLCAPIFVLLAGIALVAAALILPHNLLDAWHGEGASLALTVWHQGGYRQLWPGLGAIRQPGDVLLSGAPRLESCAGLAL